MTEHEPAEPKSTPDEASLEAAPKPRRRRTVKKAEDVAAEAPASAAPESVLEPAVAAVPIEEAAAPRPRAPRKRRSVASAVPADAGEPAAEAGMPPPEAPAALQGDRPASDVPTPALAAPPAAVAPTAVPTAEAPAGDGEASAGEGSEPGTAEAGAPREGSGRRRNRRRNRDRDRRDRPQRPEGDAAPEGSEEAAAAAQAVPLPPTDPAQLFAEVLSGAFDQEPEVDVTAAPAEPPKRVLLPEPDAPKLHKVLAQSGIGSRRDMEQWVQEGRVTVNGEPAHTGQRISFGDRIAVDGKPVKVRIAPLPPRVLAYHKPVGEVVTHDDPQHRPTVFRRLPRLPHGKWQSVGRLDINTEGLLLFTNSGELANQLMHPRFGVEREYAVRSLGVLDEEQRQRLLEGVEIEGQRAGFKSIDDGGGEGVNHWYRVVITEGRHREVRRLFEAVGHAVSRLIRIRYGCVVLPRGLKRGVWVDLAEPDVRALRRLTGTERPRDNESDAGGPRGKRGRRGGRQRDRGPREGAPERTPRHEAGADNDGPMRIPNPLQQTYDKRFIQQARAARRELTEDDPIPNPLQQTYDRRALQRDRQPVRDLPDDGPIPNPLQQTYDRRFVQKGGGGGGGGRGQRGGGGAPGGGRQPDPMQTALGYIGADALRGKRGKGGGRGGPRKGGGGAGGGGGPGGPRGGRGGRGR